MAGDELVVTARVLVADDSTANVKLLQVMLATEYLEVVVARDGPDALIQVAECAPDVVLLDGMMPGMDGFEVCRRIKGAARTTHVPVLLVTTLDDPAHRMAALDAGADDLLAKPVDRKALIARVRSLARHKMTIDVLRGPASAAAPCDARGGAEATILGLSADLGRVLVIEDRPEISDPIRVALGAGHRVHVEKDAEDALLLVRRADFDVLAVDLALDGESGLRVCARLRALEETRHTPLLAIDWKRDDAVQIRALDLGVDGLLTPPIHNGELLARVDSQVRRKRYWDELRRNPRAPEAIDPLTSMHDRSFLEEHLGTLVARNVERGRPVSLLLIDVDRLQQVNDAYDFDVGDEVLRETARRISSSVRGLDLSCRFGGEEFVAAFPGVDRAHARRIGERLRRKVGDCPFPIDTGNGPLAVTISIGSATTSGSGDTADALLERADQALYQAKKEGRNRVTRA
jgi:two-component system cell cycle response regulator